MTLDKCLSDLNERIDVEWEDQYTSQWMEFLNGKCRDEVFTPPFRPKIPPTIEWPEIHINDAVDDVDLMVWSEMKYCSDTIAAGGNTALCVRSNFGCSILPSLFGCELYTMPRRMDSLPTSIPLHDLDEIVRIIDAGVPDIRAGQGAIVFDTARRFVELADRGIKLLALESGVAAKAKRPMRGQVQCYHNGLCDN